MISSKRKTYFCARQIQNVRHVTTLSNQFPETINLPTTHCFCFENKWVLNPIFSRMFWLHEFIAGHLKKYKSVTPITPHDLNCFGYVIYVSKTSTCQIITQPHSWIWRYFWLIDWLIDILILLNNDMNMFWRWPWCNGYRCGKWTRRHEFKSWKRLISISHSTNTVGKGMNPIYSPSSYGD